MKNQVGGHVGVLRGKGGRAASAVERTTRQGDWDKESLSNLLNIPQLGTNKAGIQTLVV